MGPSLSLTASISQVLLYIMSLAHIPADSVIAVQAEGWPALAPPNMPGPMLGGNFFAGSSSSPQPGTGMVPPTLPANGALPGEAPRYEGQLVSHIMQVQRSCS